jgi:hypothetical protein
MPDPCQMGRQTTDTSIPASGQQALFNKLTALGTDMLQVTYDANALPSVVLPPQSVAMVARIGPVTVASAVPTAPTRRAPGDALPGNVYSVTKSAIIAMSSCSRLWQCSMNRPG